MADASADASVALLMTLNAVMPKTLSFTNGTGSFPRKVVKDDSVQAAVRSLCS
jgi:hypothetical protein